MPAHDLVLIILQVVLLILIGILIFRIIERRKIEAELREAQERFRAIADYTYDWENWYSPEGQLLWVNPSVERLTGYSPEECLAMPDYPLPILDPRDRQRAAELNRRALQERTEGKDETFRIRRKDGKVRWIAVSWQPIYNSRGDFMGSRMSAHDTTETREAQERLEETNRELDAFVHTVAHDLRTPLTPIIGFAEFLQKEYKECLNDMARGILKEIETQGLRMHAMLEDLLKMARVEKVEPGESVDPVDVKELVDKILLDLAPRQQESGLDVQVGDFPPVPIPRLYLHHIFQNLLDNALQYAGADGGPIEVGGRSWDGRVRFFVRDHGPGVPDQEKESLFDLFYRGSTGNHHRKGTGVGLSTVRRIARRCGGNAWVEDTPGGGSTFWVEMELFSSQHM